MSLIDHPYPQLRRDEWQDCNGVWDFAFDDDDEGIGLGWSAGFETSRTIHVPFVYQSELSGIGDTADHPVIWYQRAITVHPHDGNRMILHFEAVDYECTVWVNGVYATHHIGGNSRFAVDITPLTRDGDNLLVLRVTDLLTDLTIPRGKQYWKTTAEVMWFTPMSGIWRDVWLETKPVIALDDLRLTPHIEDETIEIEARLSPHAARRADVALRVDIEFQGEPVTSSLVDVRHGHVRMRVGLDDFNDHGLGHWWSPEHPNLYDLTLTLLADGKPNDVVHSYFGMRKVEVVNGKFCLNNRPYFLRMVLDQGYFPESILTPASFGALERDVRLTKRLGFNTVRKHMMSCQARYAYLADVYGLLVWGEMAAAYDYSEQYAIRMVDEWKTIVQDGYNHPSIVAWVPLNESWGVPDIYYSTKQQAHASSLYYLTKSLDDTRPVISNDGWEHTVSDLFTVHDYCSDPDVIRQRYASVQDVIDDMPGLEGRKFLFCPGYGYAGQPMMCTEMGGVNYRLRGLGADVLPRCADEQEFLRRVRALLDAYYGSPLIQGVCYTQLTDTQTEICGLLTWDREPKAPIAELRRIITGKC